MRGALFLVSILLGMVLGLALFAEADTGERLDGVMTPPGISSPHHADAEQLCLPSGFDQKLLENKTDVLALTGFGYQREDRSFARGFLTFFLVKDGYVVISGLRSGLFAILTIRNGKFQGWRDNGLAIENQIIRVTPGTPCEWVEILQKEPPSLK